MDNFFECDFCIKYNEINYNNNELSDIGLLQILTETAGRHSTALGYGLLAIPTTHVAWVILNWKICLYKRPIYGDTIHIKTWPRKIAKAFFFRDFELYCNNELIGIATSKWVAINTITHEMIINNSDIAEKFSPYDAHVFEDEIKKPTIPDSFDLSTTYKISRRDIDTNKHVNNAAYILIGEEIIPEEIFSKFNYNNIEIMYKTESKLGEIVKVQYKKISESEFTIYISSEDENTIHCVINYKK